MNLVAARQIASWTALHDDQGAEISDSMPDISNLTPIFEAATSQIAQLLDLPELRSLPLVQLTRNDWAERQLQELIPVLTSLSGVVKRGLQQSAGSTDLGMLSEMGIDGNMMDAIVGSIAPTLVGTQGGALLGTLSHVVLGRYDFALPAATPSDVWIVPGNISRFVADWNLPIEEVLFVVIAHEVLHHVLRTAPALSGVFDKLLASYTDGYSFDPEQLGQSVMDQHFDMDSEPEIAQTMHIDPMVFIESMRTEAQSGPRLEMRRFVALTTGIVDTVLSEVIRPLTSSFEIIDEARRRNRVDGAGQRAFLEALLGVNLAREDYEVGNQFARGVMERAGLAGLSLLWTREDALPTASEFEAPGLWLARLELSL